MTSVNDFNKQLTFDELVLGCSRELYQDFIEFLTGYHLWKPIASLMGYNTQKIEYFDGVKWSLPAEEFLKLCRKERRTVGELLTACESANNHTATIKIYNMFCQYNPEQSHNRFNSTPGTGIRFLDSLSDAIVEWQELPDEKKQKSIEGMSSASKRKPPTQSKFARQAGTKQAASGSALTPREPMANRV